MNKDVSIYDPSKFYLNTSVRGISFSYDGEAILYSSNETGCFNVYRVLVSNGKREQLTQNLRQYAVGISYFPCDNRFLFSQDRDGDELFHLWICEENGTVKDLTPGINLKANFLQWSDDDKHFWVLHNQRDPKSFDVYSYQSKDYQSRRVFKNQEALTICTISRDGRWVACEKEKDSRSNSLFLYEISKKEGPGEKGSKQICISGLENIGRFKVLGFSPDSRKIFYTSNQDSEFEDAWSFDIEIGVREKVIQVGWDVRELYFSPSGRYCISEINQDSNLFTSIQDLRTSKDVSLPQLSGAISQVHFSKDERYMAFYNESCVSSPELHLVDLDHKRHLQLTTFSSYISKDDLVTAEVIRYPSFDGLDIPSLLYRPWESTSNNKVPAMILVHGGPGDQSCRIFDPLIQCLVNQGYAVLAVNHRGSKGYGKTFFHLADRKNGDVDVKDCVYGRKYLETLDWIDRSSIGIMGSSYGGYIAVASLTFEPDAFDVAINIFGVMNWIRTLASIPSWMESTRRRIFGVMGDPDTDAKRLRAISPYFHAKNICKPLLVIQGKNDPRVLKVESDDIVRDVRSNGIDVEYLMFEDEGHGFYHRTNLITVANTCLTFLNRHLKKNFN